MKTVFEWMQEIPEPHRAKAIKNISNGVFIRGTKVSSITAAIKTAFWWAKSPEGHYYWKAVSNRLQG
jgi:hypothetical protein